jgi:hypothetical protein
MSLIEEKRGKKTYYTFQMGAGRKMYLGPSDNPDPDKIREAMKYPVEKIEHYSNILRQLQDLLGNKVSRRLLEAENKPQVIDSPDVRLNNLQEVKVQQIAKQIEALMNRKDGKKVLAIAERILGDNRIEVRRKDANRIHAALQHRVTPDE